MITITWHLVLMIVITAILIYRIFTDSEFGLDFSVFIYGLIVLALWSIYGGIFLW